MYFYYLFASLQSAALRVVLPRVAGNNVFDATNLRVLAGNIFSTERDTKGDTTALSLGKFYVKTNHTRKK